MTTTGKEKPGVVLVDLDGTMAAFQGYGDGKIGALLPGVRETLTRLKAEGHQVLVWTTRGDCPEVRAFMACHALPYDGFFAAEKPMDLTLILDDRAYRADNRGLDSEAVLAATTPEWKVQRAQGREGKS